MRGAAEGLRVGCHGSKFALTSVLFICISALLVASCGGGGGGGSAFTGGGTGGGGGPFATLTITSVSPNSGSVLGGTTVTISGAGLDNGASVRFGGTNAVSVAVRSSTQVMATTPAHTPGPVDVVVTNAGGQAATLRSGFTFTSPPTVSSVSPISGPSSGGTSVTITGTNFQTGAQVLFGGVLALSTTVNSSTQIQAVAPQHSAGTVDVQVRNPDGQQGRLAQSYSYAGSAPSISNSVPPSGPLRGGTVVTITGGGFQSGATVTFGGIVSPGVTVVNATTILARTPPHSAGVVDIVVANPDGQSATRAGGFEYPGPPTITSISPSSGDATGGTTVTIRGTSFLGGMSVLFGTRAAVSVAVVNTTQMTVVTPAAPVGPVDVSVTSPDGLSTTANAAFTFTAGGIVVRALSREAGVTEGATSLRITGSGFQGGASVRFGNVASTSAAVISSTQIQVITPRHPASGLVDVTVRNPDGSTGTLSNIFSYEPGPAVTYFSVDFENDTLGPLTVNVVGTGQRPVVSMDFAHRGTKSAKCVIAAGGARGSNSELNFFWGTGSPPNPPVSNVNGLYQRWYLLLPQSTLTNVNNTAGPCAFGTPPCGQIKLLLNRYVAERVDNWLHGGIGPEFGPFVDLLPGTEAVPNTWVNQEDGVIPDAISEWSTAVTLQANTWYEIETFYKRDASTSRGHAKMWINGKLVTDTGPLPGLGVNDPRLQLGLSFGAVYGQNQAGPLTAYVDDAAAADGFIEPVP